jgi:hypothetical protein
MMNRRMFLRDVLGTVVATSMVGIPAMKQAGATETKQLHRAAILDGDRLTVGERFNVGDRIAYPGGSFRVVGKDAPNVLVVR